MNDTTEPDLMGWAIHRTAVKIANSRTPGPITDELVWGVFGTVPLVEQLENILTRRVLDICSGKDKT